MASLRSFRPLLTRAYAPRVSLARPLLSSDMRVSLRRNYATTPNQAPKQGSNPLLWIGCISLGVAYTYYEKKQKEKKDDNDKKTDDSKSAGDTSKKAIVDSDLKPSEVPSKHADADSKSSKQAGDDSKSKGDSSKQAGEDSKSTGDTSKQAIVDSKSTGVTSKQADSANKSKNIDYQQVYNDIAELLDSNPDYDDGSYGPVLLRLAWHSSGTYNKEDHSGGSSGGTMRFRAESSHAANNGLEVARDLLEKKIKPKYPEISYGDMYTLGGVVAIQELGGPTIKWRPGRKDQGENKCTPDGRLPDGAKLADHVRDIFYRMGFNDQEIVALTGAHVLGRCHLERSGFDGPWQEAPTFFSNEYFKAITSREWVKRDLPNGSWQWVDKNNREVMMLPIEIAMLEDKELKPYFELYAKDMGRFYNDFAAAFKKLIELGVEFKGDEKEYEFERSNI